METLQLTSQVVWDEDQYAARIDGLDVQGLGNSVEEAQDQLIQSLRAWIELQESSSKLEQSLEEAGYPGVEETTEVQLEFVESPQSGQAPGTG